MIFKARFSGDLCLNGVVLSQTFLRANLPGKSPLKRAVPTGKRSGCLFVF